MIVLGIETSCDETAAAVVDIQARRILGSAVHTQLAEHAPYGGVVPEIASRAHLQRLPTLTEHALKESGLSWSQIDAIAATTGPGLTTALVIGSTFAKTLAVGLGKPFLATNHIEGHALTPHLTNPELTFPFLLLLVSGGHCQLVMVENVGHYRQLGTTVDDAVGECFDKVGKLLGLPHPAGPAIEQLAQQGNPEAVKLPFPLNDGSLNFSFSGLKTAVRDYLQTHAACHQAQPDDPKAESQKPKADLAASFQSTCAHILAKKASLALQQTGAKHLVAAGGVAANLTIRAALEQASQKHGATFTAPPLKLCTDNAVMIAYAAGLRALNGLPTGTLATPPRPRWPLAEMSQLPTP